MSGFLLDTNALSEASKPQPDPGYQAWFKAVSDDRLFISCIALGEIQKGITLVSDKTQQATLQHYLTLLTEAFRETTLSIDQQDCLLWGELLAHSQQRGLSAPVIDALLAAQALRRGLTLVTRNSKDFDSFAGLQILSPWST